VYDLVISLQELRSRKPLDMLCGSATCSYCKCQIEEYVVPILIMSYFGKSGAVNISAACNINLIVLV
jgi:hypothetical protein